MPLRDWALLGPSNARLHGVPLKDTTDFVGSRSCRELGIERQTKVREKAKPKREGYRGDMQMSISIAINQLVRLRRESPLAEVDEKLSSVERSLSMQRKPNERKLLVSGWRAIQRWSQITACVTKSSISIRLLRS